MIRYLQYGALLGCTALTLLTTGCDSSSGQKAIEAGIRALETGDATSAVHHWEKARRKRPGSSAVYYNLGTAYWLVGELEKAEKAFIQANALAEEGSPKALEFLGHVRLQRNDVDGARDAFEQAGDDQDLSARLEVAKALTEIHAQPQRQVTAQAYLNGALRIDPTYAPALYNLASLQRDSLKDPEEAARTFKRYIKAAPQDNDHVQKARDNIRRMEESGTSTATGHQPPDGVIPPPSTHANALVAKARAEMATHPQAALASLERAVAMDPAHADALWLQAQVLTSIPDQADRARNTYELFRRRFPADPRVKLIPNSSTPPAPVGPTPAERAREAFNEGERHRAARDWDKAEAAYTRALVAQPNHKTAALYLGYVMKSSGDLEGAVRAFSRAAKLDPRNPEPLFMKAHVHWESKDDNAAANALDKVFSIDTNYAKAYLLMAYVRWDQGKQRAARSHMQRFVELSPPGPTADKAKAWLRQNQGH